MGQPAKTLPARPDILALYPAPEGGVSWMQAARDAAAQRLAEMGAPLPRDEYWKFTKPAAFVGGNPTHPSEAGAGGAIDGALYATRVVFSDGGFDAEASDALTLANASVERLQDVAAQDIHWARDAYGSLETKGHAPVPRPLAALNTARAADGLVIRATGSAPALFIDYVNSAANQAEPMLHHVIHVEAGAALTLIEDGPNANRSNVVIEVRVEAGGRFNHIRMQGSDDAVDRASFVFADMAENALFKSFTLSAQGKVTRNECVVWINGDDASAHIAGAALGDGKNVHHDDTVFVTHDAVNCESRQVFKKVLKGGAVGVFQGKILVQPDAQKTDGYQISQSMLLDDASQFLAKPELEIYADDVACSHGSTSGAIDEEALFYLRARGVTKAEAQRLLEFAFLAEVVEEIEDEALVEMILARLADWQQAKST